MAKALWRGLLGVSFCVVMGCGDGSEDPETTGSGTTASDGTDATSGSDGTSATDGTGSGVCEPGEQFCNGKELMTCQSNGGGYTSVECPNGCESAQCVTGCVPKSVFCKDSGTLVTCNANRVAVESVCEKGCEDDQCVVIEPICEPGEVLCEIGGEVLLKCGPDGTSATTYQVCPHGCTEGTSECLESVCDLDDTRCAEDDPKVIEVCLPDQTGWKKVPTSCKEKCVEVTGQKAECWVPNCQPGTTQCGALGVEICDEEGAKFDLEKPCKVGCVQYDADTAAPYPDCAKCDVGLKQCNVDSVTAESIVEECVNAETGFAVIDTCSELEACASAQCVDVLVLSAEASKSDSYLLVMKAFVDCFIAAKDGSCRSIDSSAIDYPITPDDLSTWFCDNKEVGGFSSEFGSQDKFLAADDIIGGCGWFEANVQDMTFETGKISPGKTAHECIGYSGAGGIFSVNSKEVIVDLCTKF